MNAKDGFKFGFGFSIAWILVSGVYEGLSKALIHDSDGNRRRKSE